MNVASIINTVRTSGGEITLAGGRIRLKIRSSLHDETVARVRAHRGAITQALILEAVGPWDTEDWRAFYDERAGIVEFDGGASRKEAEQSAFESCVSEWMLRHQGNRKSAVIVLSQLFELTTLLPDDNKCPLVEKAS